MYRLAYSPDPAPRCPARLPLSADVLTEEHHRWLLLREEERAAVAALRDVHHRAGRQYFSQFLYARAERIAQPSCDPNRDSRQRAGLRDRIRLGEPRRRRRP